MNNSRLLGVVLLVAGAILLVMGLNASDSVADRFSKFFTGHFTDATVWFIVGGAVAGIVGLSLLTFGRHVPVN